ncbi:MAG: hypothetical protein NVSMB51_04470 [Solirubrobacteraceae bacterium]
MRARDAYRMIVTREGRAPAFLAAPDRVDRVEIVEIDSGEVILFWDLEPREATRTARRLRTDLAVLTPDEFTARWR